MGISFRPYIGAIAPRLILTGNPERVAVIGASTSSSDYGTYYRFVTPWGDWSNGLFIGEAGYLDNNVTGAPAPGFDTAFDLLDSAGYLLRVAEGQPVAPLNAWRNSQPSLGVGGAVFLTRLSTGFLAGGATGEPCPPPLGGNPPCYNFSPHWIQLSIAETDVDGTPVPGTLQSLGCSGLQGPHFADAATVDGGEIIAVPSLGACPPTQAPVAEESKVLFRSSAGAPEPGGVLAVSNTLHLFPRSDGAWLILGEYDPSFVLISKTAQIRTGPSKIPLVAGSGYPRWVGVGTLGDRVAVAINFESSTAMSVNPAFPNPLPTLSAIELLNESGELVSSIATPPIWGMVASPSGKSILVVTGDPATRTDLVRYDCVTGP
jgi:hypothetical protein